MHCIAVSVILCALWMHLACKELGYKCVYTESLWCKCLLQLRYYNNYLSICIHTCYYCFCSVNVITPVMAAIFGGVKIGCVQSTVLLNINLPINL